VGTLVLAGPQQRPDPALRDLAGIMLPGSSPYDLLPTLLSAADVLVLPYADLPVTRAMQPLKLKECLATGRPVVARALPAIREWAAFADVVETAEQFVTAVAERARSGIPAEQVEARRLLVHESWQNKARQFESFIFAE
jgi:glycosyltransferase involved in cell wall biosynthesis